MEFAARKNTGSSGGFLVSRPLSFQAMNRKALKSYHQLLSLAMPFALYVLLSWWLLGKPQLCLWRAFCGYPCPGCGLSHAAWYFLTFRFAESFKSHALFLPVFLTLLEAVLPPQWSPLIAKMPRPTWWYTLLGLAMTIYFVLRLLLYYPGESPMCYEEQNLLQLLSGKYPPAP